MLRKLSHEIKSANKEHPGSPILLFDLRQRVPDLDKEEFDDSILNLAESEGYQLVKHLYPESLNKQELELMVPDGEGNFYCAIIMRPGKDLLSTRRGWPQIPVHSSGYRSGVLAGYHNGLLIGYWRKEMKGGKSSRH